MMNEEPKYDKYDYNWRDPKQNYELVKTTNLVTKTTQKIIDDKENCGDALTIPLKSPKEKSMETPDVTNLVKYGREKIIGYYSLRNVLDIPVGKLFKFYDIDILLVAAPDWSDSFARKAGQEIEKL